MKNTLIIAALALGMTGCEARNPNPVIYTTTYSPVYVAFELYMGCMRGTLASAKVPSKVQDVSPFVASLNQYCIDWMYVWYPTMADEPGSGLTMLETRQLEPMVRRVIYDLERQFTNFAQQKSLTK